MTANIVFMVKFYFWDHLLYARYHGNKSCFKKNKNVIQKTCLSCYQLLCNHLSLYMLYGVWRTIRVQTWYFEFWNFISLLGLDLLSKEFKLGFQLQVIKCFAKSLILTEWWSNILKDMLNMGQVLKFLCLWITRN